MSTIRRPALALALTALAVAVAAGCSEQVTAPPEQTAEPAAAQRTYAMTGLPAPASWKPRPVFVVKVDNTPGGRPQHGINSADLVVVEPVEGDLTRLAAFYETRLPESVGPVRSVRISDIGLVKPVAATVAASGGAPITVRAFEKAHVPLLDETHDSMLRDPSRTMPNNLFVDLNSIDRDDVGKVPPRPYFDFGTPKLPAGQSVKDVTIHYTPQVSEQWTWAAGRDLWQRADSTEYTANTMLLLKVRLRDAGYRDAAGSQVPVVVSSGRGEGYLLYDGQAHEIGWSKKSEVAAFEITTPQGLVIQVPRGRTWLGLLTQRGGKIEVS